jgi:hypothetical protein
MKPGDQVREQIASLDRAWREKCLEADTLRQHHANAEVLLLRIYRETHGLGTLTSDTEKRIRDAILPSVFRAAYDMGELE